MILTITIVLFLSISRKAFIIAMFISSLIVSRILHSHENLRNFELLFLNICAIRLLYDTHRSCQIKRRLCFEKFSWRDNMIFLYSNSKSEYYKQFIASLKSVTLWLILKKNAIHVYMLRIFFDTLKSLKWAQCSIKLT